MLDIKKVRARRKTLLAKHYLLTAPVRLENWGRMMGRIAAPIDTVHRYHAWQGSVGRLFTWVNDLLVQAIKSDQPAVVRAAIGLVTTNFLYSRHMRKELIRREPERQINMSQIDADTLLLLQAAGHCPLAMAEADFSLSTPRIASEHYTYLIGQHDAFSADRHAWFGFLFSMTAPERAAPYGVVPTPEDLGPFWVLLQNWADPDPEKVQNALQAAQDLLIANALIGSDKAHFVVGDAVLFWDYLPRAVNQRRKERGLAPVQIETYLDADPCGDAPLPFVRDDQFWPSYLRYCAELNIEPMHFPGEVIDIRLDPVTGLISL